MVPVLDQTRTTGLVTLPGAFIGALLGGANPEDAARFQIVVLAAIICAEAIVAVIMVTLLGAPARIPAEPESQPAH
jgi:putative ABC transport system permease protein